MPAEIVIDDLTLRVPGLDERRARWLGQEVSRRLAARLVAMPRVRSLSGLDVRLDAAVLGDLDRHIDRAAEAITRAILEKLCP